VTGILNPLASLTIPLLALLLVLIVMQSKTREARRVKLGLAPTGSSWKPLLLTTIPATLMLLALFRPYAGSTDVTVPASNDDYMFVVDVSRSMFAKDIPPSRMELAKRKLKDLIDEFTRKGTPHRYGITLFAGYSYLLCPITDDTSVVKQFISEISPEMVTSLGSNLEAGMTTALARFTDATTQNARILLVSDGEDDQLSLNRVLDLIKAKKIRVDVLGVGTTTGTPIELEDGSFLRDSGGSVVHSKLGENSLRAIAEAGSGVYVRATVDDRDILQLAKAALSLKGGANQGTRTIRTYDELGSWLALGALVVLLLVAAIPRTGALIRSVALLVLLTSTASASPLTSSATARAAYDLYSEGKFKESVEAFKAALQETPNDSALRQGYASALFKNGSYREAQQIFNALASQATNGKDYFENTYNEGNALLALKRYQDAIDAFTKALDVKPDDERAVHNKAVAKALLEEEKNRPTPTPTPTKDPNQPPQPSPSPSPQSSPDQSDPEKQDNENQQDQQQGSPSPSPAASPNGSPQPEQSPSSDNAATPSPNPSASSSSQPASSPSPDPSASAIASAQPSPGEGSPTAHPDEEDQDERLKENRDQEPPPDQNISSKSAALDTRSPSQKEAEAWLESLPESPLLIRRERGRPAKGGQTW
jgi:Ca-activated chloride channel family protein